MSGLWNDIKFAFRMLAKKPGFSALVVLSLGLAIAANTTIFSFINELLFRPAPVEEPKNLWQVWTYTPDRGSALERYGTLSYPGYSYYRDHNQHFESLAAFDPEAPFVSWNRDGMGELIQCQFVSGDFFDVCKTKMALGRAFLPDEDRTPGTHPVIVLNHRFWNEHLDADREIVGKELMMNGVSLTVVGVAPVDFSGLIAGITPDCWSPFMMLPFVEHDAEWLERKNSHSLLAFGRIKPGYTVAQAEAELTALTKQQAESDPDKYKNMEAVVLPATMVPLPFRGFVRMFTSLLMGAVSLVLLIACANAAHLLFARAVARRQEIAARASLGATRGRLIRQLLTESVILAALSGSAGLLLSYWFVPVLLTLVPSTLPIRVEIHLDERVFLFTLLLAVSTGVLFGLVPALHGTRDCLAAALKSDSRTSAVKRSRFAGMLIAGQIAVCFVLLIAGTLCIRSLFNAQNVDIGFKTDSRVTAEINVHDLAYTAEQANAFYKNMQERVAALPGVESVAMANYLPLDARMDGGNVTVDGYELPQGREGIFVQTFEVSPGYFSTMGTVLLQGRGFTDQDRDNKSQVVIINEEMAKRYWKDRNPIGGRIGSGGNAREVIGVVQTGKYRHLGEEAKPVVFYPLQLDRSRQTLVAQVRGGSDAALGAIRNVARELDPRLALTRLGTMEQHLSLTLFPVRTTGFLLGTFGVAALLLAASGLFGVIAYSVSQRTREIGIRVALGAQYRDVLRLVMRQGISLVAIGLAVGFGSSLAASRFLHSFLFGVSSTDVATFTAITILLALVAFLACYIPAHRAAKTNPMNALRYE